MEYVKALVCVMVELILINKKMLIVKKLMRSTQIVNTFYPAGICLLKVNSRNTRNKV